jgi:hypothetical protein
MTTTYTIVPTKGRIVEYTLTKEDCDIINKRRCDSDNWRAFHRQNSNGTMVHVGNYVQEGSVAPAMIVAVWDKIPEAYVNLKVELDGSDSYWKTSVRVGEGPGTYQWMEYQKGQAAKTEAAEAKLKMANPMSSAVWPDIPHRGC